MFWVFQGFNELKDEFEETKYEVLKYAIWTLVAVSAAEAVMIYLMIS